MYVYFFQIDDDELIKIGYSSKHISKRQKELERGSAATLDRHVLRLLAWVHGSRADESGIHSYFAEELIRVDSPEIFRASWRLTNYIRWLRDQFFVSTDDTLPDRIATYDMWRPENGRSKSPPSDPLFPADKMEFTESVFTGDDYYTPLEIVAAMHDLFGRPDLDPASHVDANRHIKASRFFSKQDNGLDQTWYGKVWVNPPFSQWKLWAAKIAGESKRADEMCILSAMRTITSHQFQPVLAIADSICIIKGRLKFNGRGTESPDDGHCVIYSGRNTDKFRATFGQLGFVFDSQRHKPSPELLSFIEENAECP